MNNFNPDNKIAFFSDLDQTLVYSTRSWKLRSDGKDFPSLAVGEIYEGKPYSFLTYSASLLLAEFSENFAFIPTTTRTTKQYNRINLPLVRKQYAITTNGAVILENGVEDEDWSSHIQKDVLTESAPNSDIYAALKKTIDTASWIDTYTSIENLFSYFVISKTETPDSFLQEIRGLAKLWNYKVSLQGAKLYLIPSGLHKGDTAKEVTRRLGSELVIAAGDSILDKSLLTMSHCPIRPAHGELEKEKFMLPNLRITEKTGILAGEEIVRLAYQQAHAVA